MKEIRINLSNDEGEVFIREDGTVTIKMWGQTGLDAITVLPHSRCEQYHFDGVEGGTVDVNYVWELKKSPDVPHSSTYRVLYVALIGPEGKEHGAIDFQASSESEARAKFYSALQHGRITYKGEAVDRADILQTNRKEEE